VQSALDVLGAKLMRVDDGFGVVEPVAVDADDALMTDPEEQ
jgi:hypothetical protein